MDDWTIEKCEPYEDNPCGWIVVHTSCANAIMWVNEAEELNLLSGVQFRAPAKVVRELLDKWQAWKETQLPEYTAMYGDATGFYYYFEAADDQEAVLKAREYMGTPEYREQSKMRQEERGFCGMLYQILEGNTFESKAASNRIVWDFMNGML